MRNLLQILLWISFLIVIISAVGTLIKNKSGRKPLIVYSSSYSPYTTRQTRKRLMRRFN